MNDRGEPGEPGEPGDESGRGGEGGRGGAGGRGEPQGRGGGGGEGGRGAPGARGPRGPAGHWPKEIVFGFVVMVLIFLAASIAFTYTAIQARNASNNAKATSAEADADSRRQDFAGCIAQNAAREDTNENRKAIRDLATSFYIIVASVTPDIANPEDKRVFEFQLRQLQKQLKALKHELSLLDCGTYVRPEVPADTGVGSTP